MQIFKYRDITEVESRDNNLKCCVMNDNHTQCMRKVSKYVSELENPDTAENNLHSFYYCLGHFQVRLQTITSHIADYGEVIDLDENNPQQS